eukprot:7380096-Prymnesium_polylepis.1
MANTAPERRGGAPLGRADVAHHGREDAPHQGRDAIACRGRDAIAYSAILGDRASGVGRSAGMGAHHVPSDSLGHVPCASGACLGGLFGDRMCFRSALCGARQLPGRRRDS